ncbi:MAG: hypothetical protein HKP41_04860 [Desulfobacterales bacterium]|nr:HupE/UreJ family protein [Deltaproteobacteria bacterium]NNK93665.1 hypothetical protein [Desulfobacterales bacterium]
MKYIRILITCVVIALILSPTPVLAHLVTTGMGPVYDGIGHLILTLEDLIPACAIALYAGVLGSSAGRQTLFIFPAAWFVGGIAGILSGISNTLPMPAVSFIIIGLLIAAEMHLSSVLLVLLLSLIGGIHGFLNGVAIKDGPSILGIVGISAALFVIVALVSSSIHVLKPPWTRIVVRIFGGWITAMGILLIGWSINSMS